LQLVRIMECGLCCFRTLSRIAGHVAGPLTHHTCLILFHIVVRVHVQRTFAANASSRHSKLNFWKITGSVKYGKNRKMPVHLSVPLTLSDLYTRFQGHDIIQRQITWLIVSRVWSIEWFRLQWPWVTLNLDFKVMGLLRVSSTYRVRN